MIIIMSICFFFSNQLMGMHVERGLIWIEQDNFEQEAHGPQRSPKKPVQINKRNDYIIKLIRRKKHKH